METELEARRKEGKVITVEIKKEGATPKEVLDKQRELAEAAIALEGDGWEFSGSSNYDSYN